MDGRPSKEFQVLPVLLRHYDVTLKPEKSFPNGGSTVVEQLTHQSKVGGLSPAAPLAVGEIMTKKSLKTYKITTHLSLATFV